MQQYKSIIFLLLLTLCIGSIAPAFASAATPADNVNQGFLDKIVVFLSNLFHVDLQQKTIPVASKPSPKPAPPSNQKEILAFYAEWWGADTSSFKALQKHTDLIGTIAPFWATLDANAVLTDRGGNDHNSVVKYAKEHNITTLLLVNNKKYSDSKTGIHNVLSNPSLRKTAIDHLEAYIKKYQLDGINIDFELVPSSERNNLTTFMKELSARLKPQGYIVSIDVFPKHNETTDVSIAYDYAQLAKYVDKIMLMTYDYHAGWNGAGPIAGITSVEQDLKYALTLIPKDKIYLGIAGYGYDWTSKGAESLDYPAIQQLIARYKITPQWDDNAKAPHFSYTDANGIKHQVWYENSASLKYKLNLANNYDISGVALWKLGEEDPGFWKIAQENFKLKPQ